MCKVYELTDSFTGQSFGYIHNNTKKYAKIKAQNKCNDVGYEISLHEIKNGKRNLVEKFSPEKH